MNYISVIKACIHEVSKNVGSNGTQRGPLYPSPSGNQYPLASVVNTNTSAAVKSFGISWTGTCPSPIDTSFASVSINKRAYYGL